MTEILRRFEDCWKGFERFYRSTRIWPLALGGGTPSDIIWSESDVQFHLARLCAEVFGPEWIHCEVKVGDNRIDLVVTNPDPYRRAAVQGIHLEYGEEIGKLDLAVEIAFVQNDSSSKANQYNPSKVRDMARSLEKLVESGSAEAAALCVLHQFGGARDIYDAIRQECRRVTLLPIFH